MRYKFEEYFGAIAGIAFMMAFMSFAASLIVDVLDRDIELDQVIDNSIQVSLTLGILFVLWALVLSLAGLAVYAAYIGCTRIKRRFPSKQ